MRTVNAGALEQLAGFAGGSEAIALDLYGGRLASGTLR